MFKLQQQQQQRKQMNTFTRQQIHNNFNQKYAIFFLLVFIFFFKEKMNLQCGRSVRKVKDHCKGFDGIFDIFQTILSQNSYIRHILSFGSISKLSIRRFSIWRPHIRWRCALYQQHQYTNTYTIISKTNVEHR